MKTEILIVIICILGLLLTGCESKSNDLPSAVNNATRPVIVKVINKEGVILMDGDGTLYAYKESYYFVQTLMEADIKEGFVLAERKAK